jgi:hypothetical protein
MGARKAMTTANFYVLPKPFEPGTETREHWSLATRRGLVDRLGAKNETAKHLSKMYTEAGSPWPSRLEWIVLLRLVLLAVAALACCLSELFYFLGGG